MMPLAPAQRDKLARILALLSSDQPGEVVAAAHAANKMVKAAGLSWVDVLSSAETSRRQDVPPWPASPYGPVPSHVGDLAACRSRPDLLTPWETSFVAGLSGRRSFSPRQREILAECAAKVRAAGQRAG